MQQLPIIAIWIERAVLYLFSLSFDAFSLMEYHEEGIELSCPCSSLHTHCSLKGNILEVLLDKAVLCIGASDLIVDFVQAIGDFCVF